MEMYNVYRNRPQQTNALQRELDAIEDHKKEMGMDDKKRIEHHFSESVYDKFVNLLNKVTKDS